MFALYLNPFDCEDAAILKAICELEKEICNSDRCDKHLNEFARSVTLLLKHDWERAKREAKPWVHRVFSRAPTRVGHKEFIVSRMTPHPWVKAFDDPRLAVAVACFLFLMAVNREWLQLPTLDMPSIADWIKLPIWGGVLLLGCSWGLTFLCIILETLGGIFRTFSETSSGK